MASTTAHTQQAKSGNRFGALLLTCLPALSPCGAQSEALEKSLGEINTLQERVELPHQNPVYLLTQDEVIGVQDGTIISITEQAPQGATTFDLTAYTVLPGLIDLHTHFLQTGSTDIDEAAEQASSYLESGFTTCLDLGSPNNLSLQLRDAIERGDMKGPELLVSGKIICGDPSRDGEDLIRYVTGVEEVRQAVREQAELGVDWIKIATSDPGQCMVHDESYTMLSKEEIEAAVDEAHKHGLKITAHAHGSLGFELAVKAGVDRIEHGTFMTRAHIDLLLEYDTTLVPTRFAWFYNYSLAVHAAKKEPPAQARKLLEFYNDEAIESERILQEAIQSGVKIGFGSDLGAVPHLGEKIARNINEFTLLEQVGLTPKQLITMATSGAAEELGLEDHIGKLEVGFEADIIAVPNNADKDITSLTMPVFVMSDGEIIKDDVR